MKDKKMMSLFFVCHLFVPNLRQGGVSGVRWRCAEELLGLAAEQR